MSIRMHVLVDETGKRHEVSEGIYRQLLGLDDVIEDGERVKVPLHLRDSRSPASDQRFAPVTDAMREEIEIARQEYLFRLTNAWRGDAAPSVADSTPHRGNSEVPSKSNSTPIQPPPRQHVVDERETAYNEYVSYLQTAWKAGKEAA